MILRKNDSGLSRTLGIIGIKEKEHLYILKKTLKKGLNILEIGANLGYYVLIEKK